MEGLSLLSRKFNFLSSGVLSPEKIDLHPRRKLLLGKRIHSNKVVIEELLLSPMPNTVKTDDVEGDSFRLKHGSLYGSSNL